MANITPDEQTLAEYDEIEEMIERGEICRDAGDHDWRTGYESYGEDRDGNRGITIQYEYCSKCGEEQ